MNNNSNSNNSNSNNSNSNNSNSNNRIKIKEEEEYVFKYLCKECEYNTIRESQYERHIKTKKHLNNKKEKIFKCDCGKYYKYASGLSKHKKTCDTDLKNEKEKRCIYTKDDVEQFKDKIAGLEREKELLIENKILREKLSNKSVLNNSVTNITNNSNNNVSINNTFNLNFFLNDTCKDAMNIADFINSIKLQLSDLENVGKLGYVEGVSNIIVKNLNGLDVAHRPVHCTDKKRDTLYVKDNDIWEKDEEKIQIKKVIAKITDKNKLLLSSFKQAHPSYSNSMSPFSDQYNQILIETLGGCGDKEEEKECKIIKNISKVTCLERI